MNRYFIERRLKKYDNALTTCDTVLQIHKEDFRANMYKGFLYEDMDSKDSSIFYYKKSLRLIDNPKSFKASEIVKDREKLIVIGLLNDTLEYKKHFNSFITKYDTSKFFNYYYTEFKNFNRKNYLSNY
ncbi:MAG TPA: hypothetical protein VKR53_16310 [Puia sp.]|nr:hypothetical protein [Puia sp.]